MVKAANRISANIDARLRSVERLLEAASAALIAGDPDRIEQANGAVREAVLAFTQVSSEELRAGGQATSLRLRRVALALAAQREQLLRRSLAVERELGSLLPGRTQASTYGPSMSGSARARNPWSQVRS